MKALVIYDSFFGNTQKIAQAIGRSLESGFEVKTVRVTEITAYALTGADLLVVGSPTRGFRPTEETLKLLDSIPSESLKGIRNAAFDTRIPYETIKSPFLHVAKKVFGKGDGYAASLIAETLEMKGATRAAEPEGFAVVDREGPLADGELERAEEWAAALRTVILSA